MPAFVVKVTLKDSNLRPPITAMASDEAAAIAPTRACGVAEPDEKVETKRLRNDVMLAAFGDQPEGTIAIRGGLRLI